MPQRPNLRIKRYYSIVAHSPDIVELRYGVWNPVSFTITDDTRSGHLFNLLVGLDGSLSTSELAKQENIPRAQVEALIDHLQQLGVVESSASTSVDYYLDNIVPTLARGDLQSEAQLPVTLIGDPEITQAITGYLKGSLPEADITEVSANDPAWLVLGEADLAWLTNGREFHERLEAFEAWRGHLLVFATKLINPIRLQILNRVSLEHRIPWIHAAVDGPFLFIGPTFVPHRSACYECFESRVSINLRENASYLRYKQALVNHLIKNGPMPMERVLCGMLASHVAMEALNYILTGSTFTVSKVLAIYLPTMEFTFNEVLRVPGCAGCSPSSQRDEEELYFDMRALIQNGTTAPIGGALRNADKGRG